MSIIKSFSVGNGDMFYIHHNTDNFTTIDCYYENEKERDKQFQEMAEMAKTKGITRFISTHPDEDHIKGIEEFCNTVGISNFYCVKNQATKKDESDSFKKYCTLRDSDKAYYVYKGCSRKWMNVSDETRGCAGINFLWPITTNEDFREVLNKAKDGKEYNNISPIFTYSLHNGVKVMWMGDMEHDFLEKIKDEIDWPEVDILFAPHHGRSSGKVSSDVLKKLDPYIIVIGEAPSKDLDYYSSYHTIKQNSTGDISFKCEEGKVHIYITNYNYGWDTSFLSNESNYDTELGYYLGTFSTKG